MVGNGGGSYTSLVHEVVALKVKYKTRFDLNTVRVRYLILRKEVTFYNSYRLLKNLAFFRLIDSIND